MLSSTTPRNGTSACKLPFDHSQVWSGREGKRETAPPKDQTPRADVVETKDAIVVRVEIPGLCAEGVDVNLEMSVLTIAAERKPTTKDGEVYLHSEICYGRYFRSLTLPRLAYRDDVYASYTNGILTVTLPKAEEVKPRFIEVAVS